MLYFVTVKMILIVDCFDILTSIFFYLITVKMIW